MIYGAAVIYGACVSYMVKKYMDHKTYMKSIESKVKTAQDLVREVKA